MQQEKQIYENMISSIKEPDFNWMRATTALTSSLISAFVIRFQAWQSNAYVCHTVKFNILASLCSWAGRFES